MIKIKEILGSTWFQNKPPQLLTKNLCIIKFQSEKLYKELKKMLDGRGKEYLLEYTDIEVQKRIYEEYALAKQIYKDLEK